MGLVDLFKKKYNRSVDDTLHTGATEELQRLINADPGAGLSKIDSLKINTVFACVNIISNAVASLPFDLYRRTKEGREKAVKHRLYKLAKYPSLDMPGFNFKEALITNLLVYGNAYVELVKTSDGIIRELNLIPSKNVQCVEENGGLLYHILARGNNVHTFRSDEGRLMHIAGKSFSGRIGMSVVDLGLASIKLSKALETFGLHYFETGARPSGFLKTARKLSEEAVIRLKRSFYEQYAGSRNTGKMIVLEDGMTYEAAQNGNDSSQFLESRRFAVSDIARLFNVPLFLLQETEKSTSWGSGIEQLNISFVTHCLNSWMKKIEEAYNFYLLTDKEKESYYFEFNTEGLLRSDLKSRFDAYHTAIYDGWLSPNEVRAKENLPGIEGGNVYYIPVNLAAYAGQDKKADAEAINQGENNG